jgi:hypothetical protein
VDLEHLIALEEIRALQSRYCIFLDKKRWADLAGLFAPDARLELNDHPHSPTTPNGIVGFIERSLAIPQSSHHSTCCDIELIDDDNAHGTWEALYVTEGHPICFGFYENDFRRVDGRWKIQVMRRIKCFTSSS